MSDAECGRKLYTDVLAHFRHLVAGISQADPFERKAPEPAGGLSFDPCRFESDSESPLGIQKLNVGFSNWTSDSATGRRIQKLQTSYSETTPGSGVFRTYSVSEYGMGF